MNAVPIRSSVRLPELPAWASFGDSYTLRSGAVSCCIHVETDAALREWIDLLGPNCVTRYHLEVAYQCAKLDLQTALEKTPFDPRISGKPAEFKFKRAGSWAQWRFESGGGADLATQGLEAREHYKRIRGRIPLV